MAKKPSPERIAHSGPDIEHDHMIGKFEKWNKEDGARASSAAETRSDIGQFIENTGMNKKAASWMRMVLKAHDKDQGKAMDIITSLEKALPMIKAHVAGQGTADMFPETDEPAEPAPLTVVGGYASDPDIEDEAADFESALAEVEAAE